MHKWSHFQSIAQLSMALNIGFSVIFSFQFARIKRYLEELDDIELRFSSHTGENLAVSRTGTALILHFRSKLIAASAIKFHLESGFRIVFF